MKYLKLSETYKLYEQLKDSVINGEYYFWVSNDEKYVILNKNGENYKASDDETYYYYPVFPIEYLYDNLENFKMIKGEFEYTIKKAKEYRSTDIRDSNNINDLDFWLMIRENNMYSIPSKPGFDGYKKLDLDIIDDFKVVKYAQGIFLDKKLDL